MITIHNTLLSHQHQQRFLERSSSGSSTSSSSSSVSSDQTTPSHKLQKQVSFSFDQKDPSASQPRKRVHKQPKPILKGSSNTLELLKFKEKCTMERFLQARLHKGSWLRVFNSNGSLSSQWFSVSSDGSELTWNGFGKILARLIPAAKVESICLADVVGLVPGPLAVHFELHDWSVYNPANCFIIVMRNSLICVECPNRETFMCWFLGLQSLHPMNSAHQFSKARLNWIRMFWLQTYRARSKANKWIL